MRLEPSAPRSRKVRVGRLGMRRGTGSVSRYAAPDKRIAASPTSTPNNGKAPRYAKSRRGPSAQTGQGQKERHLVASIHGLRSCGVRSRCRSTSRRAVVPPSDEIGNRSPGAGIVTLVNQIHFVVARHPPERSISSSW